VGALGRAASAIPDGVNGLTTVDGATTWTYFHDAAHQLTEARLNGLPQTTFTYDAAGNLSTRSEGGSTLSYLYDALNRLA